MIFILSFIILLGVLVFVHELGHYMAARSVGMRVEKFYIGFNPWGLGKVLYRGKETEYGIGLLEDRDLARFIEILESQAEGTNTNDFIGTRLANLEPKSNASIKLLWHGKSIIVQAMYGSDIPNAFGYVAVPIKADMNG